MSAFFIKLHNCNNTNTGALLYLVEEVKLGLDPKFFQTTTDRSQWWGKGCKTKKKPGPIGNDYQNLFNKICLQYHLLLRGHLNNM